ncbi:ABC transporter permease [Pararhizobium mangrovi]|uniref:ABC transporter permease n=1 Tax=Pararhizobium mangrovi TaxID=2590452 RepID=A0A506UGX3_9HYPH|nr:ABC transporter permease [Pararhizobium mangrovi]TPW32659.1 ABC transporter permease [Pararhizobium mangrovi]
MSTPYAKLPAWAEYVLLPFVNVVVAFLVAGLVVLLAGDSPLHAFQLMIEGAFGYGEGIGYTLYYATNFIFTGLAVAVAFHCSLFNIGGEGQAYVGGIGVAIAALWLDRFVPWWVTFPVAIALSAGFGALWAFIPGYLQAKRGSHVVITTIMFNFIASSLMVYLLVHVLKPVGAMAPQTRTFAEGGQLPTLGWLLKLFGLNPGIAPFNITFLLALVMCFLVWVLVWRTRFGYELRTLGFSRGAARYAGINEAKIIILTMMISGALAGMMALNNVMGDQFRLQLDFVNGAGFVGIAVALMGRSHPLGIIPAAILFGVLYQGGAEISFDMPEISRDMIVIIQGLVILFAGALENMFRPALASAFGRIGRSRRDVAAPAAGE